MPRGGTLTLGTRALPGPSVALAVRDTGEGMSPATLAQAVEPFFTTKPVGKGTGLGLAMVYTTVRAHGGTLDLTSSEGRGTQATLTFPARSRQAAPQAFPPQAPRTRRALEILLVDDDELIRASVPGLVATLGHRVDTAEGGPRALERLAEGRRYDLVILDLNMPGMNGAETLIALRCLRLRLHVLLATGHLDPETGALLAQDPCALSIGKPFTVEDLDQRIHQLTE